MEPRLLYLYMDHLLACKVVYTMCLTFQTEGCVCVAGQSKHGESGCGFSKRILYETLVPTFACYHLAQRVNDGGISMP